MLVAYCSVMRPLVVLVIRRSTLVSTAKGLPAAGGCEALLSALVLAVVSMLISKPDGLMLCGHVPRDLMSSEQVPIITSMAGPYTKSSHANSVSSRQKRWQKKSETDYSFLDCLFNNHASSKEN